MPLGVLTVRMGIGCIGMSVSIRVRRIPIVWLRTPIEYVRSVFLGIRVPTMRGIRGSAI